MFDEPQQAAAIPYRRSGGQLRFCLITSMDGDRWIFPKGIIDPGETAAETALKEAEEEAGVGGTLSPAPVGRYVYAWHESIQLTVEVYLLEVDRIADDWDEAKYRSRCWCTETEATALLEEHPGLSVFVEAVRSIRVGTATPTPRPGARGPCGSARAAWIAEDPGRLRTPEDAYELLARLGAAPWLIRHHQLVVEAAAILAAGVASAFDVDFDQERVLLGSALHDCGKVVHPEEMRGPGSRHEAAGEELLSSQGLPGELARICRTHADWAAADADLEDLLVALADKLWKGRRAGDLEERVVEVLAGQAAKQPWEVLILLDPVLESAAAGAAERLARANVPDER